MIIKSVCWVSDIQFLYIFFLILFEIQNKNLIALHMTQGN